jgi:translation initiation factor RLI1
MFQRLIDDGSGEELRRIELAHGEAVDGDLYIADEGVPAGVNTS